MKCKKKSIVVAGQAIHIIGEAKKINSFVNYENESIENERGKHSKVENCKIIFEARPKIRKKNTWEEMEE